MKKKIAKFTRIKEIELIRNLSRGGYGETYLVRDPIINETFVCKKYSPINDNDKQKYFKNFIEEIRLLYLVNHLNIVRIFTYYIYPENYLGYILMELVDGNSIEEYLAKYPQNINEIFRQTIQGFACLESNGVLHRDIRPSNILVNDEGIVKIIDLGFGKQVCQESDFDKSITINWGYEKPQDFNDKKYDFQTEVYFVGKLFERIIVTMGAEEFNYKLLLNNMCKHGRHDRTDSFSDILEHIREDQYQDIEFSDDEIMVYREFSNIVHEIISKIENDAKYYKDIDKVQIQLENLYQECMLEAYVPNTHQVVNCFINGKYYYRSKTELPTSVLKEFINLLRGCSIERKNIIISNIYTKLNSINRYSDDIGDIPF